MSRRRKFLPNAMEEAYATKAKEIHAQNTKRVEFYRQFLWRLFLGRINIAVPRNWSIDYFRYVLFFKGCIAVTDIDGVVVPFSYSINTRNKWRYPIDIYSDDEVALGSRKVGDTCEIIYLESANYGGLYSCGIESLIDIYAQKLANCDGAIDINLLVSRTPWIFGVEDNAQAQDMKELFTRIMSGSPAVWFKIPRAKQNSPIDKYELPLMKTPVTDNYISDKVQIEKRSIINEFLTAIGVNNANTDKKERLITGEVDSNNEELNSAIGLWKSNIDRCVKKVKAMYGSEMMGDLSIDFISERSVSSGRVDGLDGDLQSKT